MSTTKNVTLLRRWNIIYNHMERGTDRTDINFLTVWLAHFPLFFRFASWWRSPASCLNDLPHSLQGYLRSVTDETNIKHLPLCKCSASACNLKFNVCSINCPSWLLPTPYHWNPRDAIKKTHVFLVDSCKLETPKYAFFFFIIIAVLVIIVISHCRCRCCSDVDVFAVEIHFHYPPLYPLSFS